MQNEKLVKKVLPLLMVQLETLQGAYGYIYSGTRNCCINIQDPNIRKQKQNEVDIYTQGLLVVYLFAMWEAYVDRDVEKEWLPADKLTRLKAFRHIRHSVAHGFAVTRADLCRKEFEFIMESNQPFPNLPYDSDSLDLTNSQVASDCQRFMGDLGKELIGRIANNIKP